MGSLLPCLPDEIGLQCLVRVELNSHHNLRCVCKSWNATLNSYHFYQERKRLKISEQRICMLQKICKRVLIYDLEKNSCKSLPPIPTEIISIFRCHFVKQKLVLIPDLLPHFAKSCVWLYDFVCLKWRQGAKMPIRLNKFASATDEHRGMIYVAGGLTNSLQYGNPVCSAAVYNVEEDKWDLLPDMKTDMNTCMKYFYGAFADGKFYVMASFRSFEVFDSHTKSWKTMKNRFNSGDLVSAFGRLYCLSDRRLIEYDYSQDKMNIVGTFPIEVWGHSIDFVVAISNKIFVGNWDPIKGEGFFMLEPPSETGGRFKLIGIDRPSGLSRFAICAATLDL